jgi:hypothetical protein
MIGAGLGKREEDEDNRGRADGRAADFDEGSTPTGVARGPGWLS